MNNLLRSTIVLAMFIVLILPTQAILPLQAEQTDQKAPIDPNDQHSKTGPKAPIDPNDQHSTTGPSAPENTFVGYPSPLLDYEVVIPNVPAYIWHDGCGPTSSGMILGYWDGQGYDNLVSGSAQTQTAAVDDMISSSGHYNDYALPIEYSNVILPDKSELPIGDEHADDSVADFFKTSQSYYGMFYGWSWYSYADDSLLKYANLIDPQYQATAYNEVWGTFTWEHFKAQIDAMRPVELLVDSDGDGQTDHFVPAIGYGEQGGIPMYAAYNTWDTSIHWYEFTQMSAGKPYGIYGATIFYLEDAIPSSITVTSPNSGETWIRGTPNTITWSSTGNPGTDVKIELLKNGVPVGTVTSSTSNDGSYSWTISSTRALDSDYQIRITSINNPTITDDSDVDFIIGGINVNSPNGGETLVRGVAKTITWNSLGNPGPNVKIELLRYGLVVGTVTSSTPNDGSYSWTVSPTRNIGPDYKIRVTSISDPRYKDTSNNNFIIGGINIKSPNGGQSWVRGTTHAITWSSAGNPGPNVRIDLLKNGAVVGTMTSSAPNNGMYKWTISAGRAPGMDYKVKVTSTSNSAYKDTSDNNFRITES